MLPDAAMLHSDPQEIHLGEVDVSSDSQRFTQAVAEAGSLAAEGRLERLEQALGLAGRGSYLEGASSEWASLRRAEIEQAVSDARLQTAEAAFSLGVYGRAQALLDLVLEDDAFREEAWRLRMRILDALGDGDGLVSCFLGCERALAQAGLTPSPGTRQLLVQLRR